MNMRLTAIIIGAVCLAANAQSSGEATPQTQAAEPQTNATQTAAAPAEPEPVAKSEPETKPAPAAEPEPAKTAAAPMNEAQNAAAPAEPAPAQPVAETQPAQAVFTPQVSPQPTALNTQNIDEIDLEDDSAIAAKKPTVKGNMDKGLMSLVDIECDEATLADILRQFRKTTNANIISDDSTNLQKRVSVSLKRVPWLEGLIAILGSRGFRVEERDNIYRIVEDLQLIPVSTRTYSLNHASAKELAALFNATYGRKDQNGRLVMPIASSFDGANVVVVTATDKMLSECETIIKAVDKAIAQIYIEARFIELSNEALHKLGMQWNQLESWGASVRNLSAGMEYNNGRSANYGTKLASSSSSGSTSDNKNSSANTSVSAGSSTSSASTSTSASKSTSDSKTYNSLVPGGISQAPGAGRTADSMNWLNARGFSGQLSMDDFSLAMSAFESMSDVKVFSNPKIIVSNGKEAKVDMTTKYPNVTIDSNYTGLNSQNLSVSTKLDVIPGEDKFMFAKEAFFSWGIQLSVTPRISPDGLISVEIVPTISDCTGYLNINSSQETDTPYTKYPIIEVKRLTTEFTMKDGATAVIGGLSKTTEEDVDTGIPYLREIPWVGQKLFGWKSRGKVQKEILVFVTIGIADPQNLPKDIGLPKNAILGREYVTGSQLEPGDRTGDTANVLKLDMTRIDKRKPRTIEQLPEAKEDLPKGTVSIKVVNEAPDATEGQTGENGADTGKSKDEPVKEDPPKNDDPPKGEVKMTVIKVPATMLESLVNEPAQ